MNINKILESLEREFPRTVKAIQSNYAAEVDGGAGSQKFREDLVTTLRTLNLGILYDIEHAFEIADMFGENYFTTEEIESIMNDE